VIYLTFAEGDSPIHRLDPRLRVIVVAVFSILIATTHSLTVALCGLLLGALLAALAELPNRGLLTRLLVVNGFVLFLWIFLPFSHAGEEALFRMGRLEATREGVMYATLITLKCNAIALAVSALLSTIEVTALGHALYHLWVPEKLIHLYMFTIRYFHVIRHEYERLATAAKVRGFRPRVNRHTYRTYGYLVGMLLVNSLDRAERVLAAMKCRGFLGRFYLLKHFEIRRADVLFGTSALIVLAVLAWLQWTPAIP